MYTELFSLPTTRKTGQGGLKIDRHFTENIDESAKLNSGLHDIFATVQWETTSVITGSGKVIENVEFPSFWSDNARIQVAEKYFRRADVPQFPDGIYDRHQAEMEGVAWEDLPKGGEKSLKHVVNRLSGALTYWGIVHKYFQTQEDARHFYQEMAYMMIHQYGALNSPQWFNTGVHWAYGIVADAKGQWYYNFDLGMPVQSKDAFEHPQASACFILGVKDDLFGPNGIFDTAAREARIFYFGSGSGSNYSTLRGKGEPVSGGGISSGMMSFLDVFDVGGGVIKSGGKTRRAAKMDICSDTHPELIEFIQWKMRQEKMVRILIQAGMSGGFEDEAYRTVRGMNSNNTVSLSHDFFTALRNDDDWYLRWVTNPNHISKKLKARDIWSEIVYATWFSADPGIHATDTINEWNTCINDERIVSSNPCSEYLWFNETSCNLASINLIKFYDINSSASKAFNIDAYRNAIRLWQLALDITVGMAQYPAEDICRKTIEYRTTGLGYTNLGGLLMLMGLGYADTSAHQVAGALTAILGGTAYEMSAEIASKMGAYPAFERNRNSHLRVIRNHRRACFTSGDYSQALVGDFEGITKKPKCLDTSACPSPYWNLINTARESWRNALEMGERYGYRNAQTTVLAPTGTISFAMDADTFGIEPDYALIKYKALAGGGYAVIVNRLIEPALRRLGYDDVEIEAIIKHVNKTGMVEDAPCLHPRYYGVFDTAVAARSGGRYLIPRAHIDMMAACQPFLSGAISKTVNLPEEATEEEISDAYLYGYDSGLKAIAVYRANSKAASVMFTNADDLKQRQNIDLGSREFSIKDIFVGASSPWHASNRMLLLEEWSEQPMLSDEEQSQSEAAELAVEMPSYGCKDGVCSI